MSVPASLRSESKLEVIIINHFGKEKTMAQINRINIEQNNELEQLRADNARLSALLDYVAVMADVDIPESEVNENVEE